MTSKQTSGGSRLNLTREAFRDYARTYNLIPVYREILADLHTPVSAFHKLDDGRFAYLLESVEGGEQLGRYSFMGGAPYLTVMTKGREVTITRFPTPDTQHPIPDTRLLSPGEDPLSVLRALLAEYRAAPIPGLPKFFGGAVGYMGYDVVRFFERLPEPPPDDLNVPDSFFIFTDVCVIFDQVRHRILMLCNAHVDGDPDAAYDAAAAKIDDLLTQLQAPDTRVPGIADFQLDLDDIAPDTRHPTPDTRYPTPETVTSNLTREQYCAIVARAKEYIAAGDIIQVVPSQRFSRRLSPALQAQPFNLYRALRFLNPSPYMYYLNFGDLKLVGSSPELLVSEEGGTVVTRPIAGTRPRGATHEADLALERDLLADEKERAEHIMLVDLGRNDLGRVCDYGTVVVDELMGIERYSHVMHIVSNVTGHLREGLDHADVLRACFPAGTVSGAPKIRAMEIINELEPTRRGPYAGAIGYFSYAGNLDTAITIRTVLLKGDTAYVQAGGGIVADSVPENEYQETVNKAKALLRALALAEKGME